MPCTFYELISVKFYWIYHSNKEASVLSKTRAKKWSILRILTRNLLNNITISCGYIRKMYLMQTMWSVIHSTVGFCERSIYHDGKQNTVINYARTSQFFKDILLLILTECSSISSKWPICKPKYLHRNIFWIEFTATINFLCALFDVHSSSNNNTKKRKKMVRAFSIVCVLPG